MPIPLEDNFADVIYKAKRGLNITNTGLAEKAAVDFPVINALLAEKFDEDAVRKVAPHLGLNADALVAMGRKEWRPAPVELPGLAAYNTQFNDMTVNSYLIWDAGTKEAVAFDTGSDCSGMLDTLRDQNLALKLILLTHTHGDHVYDMDRLVEKTGAPAFVSDREPFSGATSFTHGKIFSVGSLKIESRLTWGHSQGGITYYIQGLEKPVAVVGDALFASSMGGGSVSYADALRTNRAEIFTLPDETILCPGHGPMTTVAGEKKHNPFFA